MRELTRLEYRVISRILSVDFPEAGLLRRQLEQVRVVCMLSPEGSANLKLWVADTAPSLAEKISMVPVDAIVSNQDGQPIGDIILWICDGRLSSLEYSWFTYDMPMSLPEPDQIKPVLHA